MEEDITASRYRSPGFSVIPDTALWVWFNIMLDLWKQTPSPEFQVLEVDSLPPWSFMLSIITLHRLVATDLINTWQQIIIQVPILHIKT